MKAKTRFRLVILLAVGAAATAGMGGYYVYRKHVNSVRDAQLRVDGLAAFKANDYIGAMNMLGEYEQSHEKDVEVLYAMARARYKVEDSGGRYVTVAASWFSKVVDLEQSVVDREPANAEAKAILADAKRTLLTLYVRMNALTEALSLADPMLAADPKDVETLRAKATVLFNSRKFTKADNKNQPGALETYQRILNIAPLDLESNDRLLTLLEHENSQTGPGHAQTSPDDFMRYAVKLAGDKEMSTRKPVNEADRVAQLEARRKWILSSLADRKVTVAGLRASVEGARTLAALEEAYAPYRVPGSFSKDPTAEIIASLACGHAQDLESARDYALQAASRAMADHEVVLQVVHLLDRLTLSGEATKLLESRNAAASGNTEARRDWALRLFYLNRFHDVVTLLNEMKVGEADADADTMAIKAWSLVRLDQKKDALDLIEIMKKKGPANGRALSWGTLLDKSLLDETAPSKAHLEAIVASAMPLQDSPLAMELVGNAFAAQGSVDSALKDWNVAVLDAPAWADPWVRASRLELGRKHFSQAFSAAGRAMQLLPGDPEAMIARALAAATVISPDDKLGLQKLLDFINSIKAATPLEPQTLAKKVYCTFLLGHQDDAKALIEKALAMTPPLSEKNLNDLAQASFQCGLGLEEKILSANVSQNGLSANSALLRATWMNANGHPSEGLSYLEKEFSDHHKGDLEWRRADAQYLDAINDKRAAEVWANLAADYPDNMGVQWMSLSSPSLATNQAVRDRILTRLEASPDGQGAVKLYRASWIIEKDGSNDLPDNMRPKGSPARESVSERIKNLQHAEELLHQYVTANPKEIIPRVQHSICLQRLDALQNPGQPPKLGPAIDEAKAALALDPGSNALILEVARLHIAQGDIGPVADLVRPLLAADSKASPEERSAAAEYLFQAGKPDASLEYLKTLKPADLTAAQQFLLARLYVNKGQYDQADPYVKKLLEQPDGYTIRFAAQFYSDSGRMPEALATLRLLEKVEMPADLRALVRGDFFVSHGDFQNGLNEVSEALRVNPTNGQAHRQLIALRVLQGDAQGTATAIMNGVKNAHDDPILKQLAANVEVIKQFVPVQGAQALVESAVRDPAEGAGSIEALKIWSDALATDENLMVTAQKLKPIADTHPHNLALQMFMIQKYANCGRMTDAIAVAQSAMQAFPNSPQPAEMATVTMAALRQWDEVILRAGEWKRRAPQQALQADQHIADAYIWQGKPEAAMAVLEPYIIAAKAEPEKNAQTILLYARGYVSGNHYDEARALMRPLNKRNLEWVQVTLTLIAEGVTDEKAAGEWMNELDGLIPDKTLERARYAQAWYNLSDRFRNMEFLKRSRDMLVEIVKNPDVPSDVLSTAGAVYEALQDPKNAEAMYDRALKLNPHDLLAANNEAMICVRRGTRLQDALNLINVAVKDQPNFAAFHDTRSAVLAAMGNIPEAIREEALATKREPQNAEWWLGLLKLQVEARDPKLATTKDIDETLAVLDAQRSTLNADQQKRLATLRAKR